MAKLPKGFTCECGYFHEFSVYVYAHWDISLTHTCPCGTTHNIKRGKATVFYRQRRPSAVKGAGRGKR